MTRWTKADLAKHQGKTPKKRNLTAKQEPASSLEALFDLQLRALKLPRPKMNHQFLPTRGFTFDRVWLDSFGVPYKVAVEIEGSVHRIAKSSASDYEKFALALLYGWHVLRIDKITIKDGRAIQWTKALLLMKGIINYE